MLTIYLHRFCLKLKRPLSRTCGITARGPAITAFSTFPGPCLLASPRATAPSLPKWPGIRHTPAHVGGEGGGVCEQLRSLQDDYVPEALRLSAAYVSLRRLLKLAMPRGVF